MKKYTLEIVSAEAYSMETDHFNIKNPKTGNTRYVRPHARKLRDNRDAHRKIVDIWRKCVQIMIDRDTFYHEEVFVKGLSAFQVQKWMGEATIDLTMEELNLINEYAGY